MRRLHARDPLESRTHKQLESLARGLPADAAFFREKEALLATYAAFYRVPRHDLLFATSNTGDLDDDD